MDKPSQPNAVPAEWLAYGPEKDAWKRAGNCCSPGQLREMEAAATDLRIERCPDQVFDAS
jgi:hypothetical protein